MGPKKGPLTMEERKAKKEAKRLEKERQEREKLKQLRRDELTREIHYQSLRKQELDKDWREAMMKIKEPVFKQEVEIMWHVFERLYDKRDHLIAHTLKLIDIADDQYQRTISAFCDMIDTMIKKFRIDLDTLSKDNDRRTTALLKWGADIRNKIQSDHKAAELHLQILLYWAHTTHDNYMWNMRGEHMVKEDEELSNFLDVRDRLKSFLEDVYIKMWDEYKSVLKSYIQGTAENQKNVRRLRRKEDIMADIIASQDKRLANSDKLLARLRAELAQYESGEKQAVFRDRRDRHRAAAQRLKKRLLGGLSADEDRLNTLVKCSDELIEWLSQVHKKGMQIMRLAALCRKYETQREKVLPFDTDIPPDDTLPKANLRHQQSDDSLIATAMASTSGLVRLWSRIARVELGKRALLREKMLLQRENDMIMESMNESDNLFLKGSESTIRCICGDEKKKPKISKPVAINGAIEIAKYRKYY
ncbi:sperm tail domain-containing protein [Phthorimaea operculella]|nr:sperm tail domain-containing protein [Phthorimaea operculella]